MRSGTRQQLNHSHQTVSGFTLVEMLMVLAILATLSGLALPAVMRWSAEHEVQSVTARIIEVLQQARVTAMKSGEGCRVEFDNSTRRVVASHVETPAGLSSPEIDRTSAIAFCELPIGFTVRQTTGIAPSRLDAIEFFHDGTSSGQTWRVLTPGEDQIELRVNPLTGSVDVSLLREDVR